ncbi:glycosyltransferase [Desulfovibrio sp. OttesenSCG-928-F07]|nr:glycosyltransferase [Desulfovibrio sp. OttesenSCG-928-F07]
MANSTKLVVIPDSGADLLRAELVHAFKVLGFSTLQVTPAELATPASPRYLPRLLDKKPALFFSVNLQGLIPGGELTKQLAASGTPTVAWFVDNPWNQLSAMRDPSWKNIYLAVTDHTFIAPLTSAGAKRVLHMPLAASPVHMQLPPELMHKTAQKLPALNQIVFAGRSAFAGMQDFFAGQQLPLMAEEKAESMLKKGFGANLPRPDFNWWVKELELKSEQQYFWPGKKARRPGFGAAKYNMQWRAMCLKSAAGISNTTNTQSVAAVHSSADMGTTNKTTSIGYNTTTQSTDVNLPSCGLSLFGDTGWQQHQPEQTGAITLHPPVDYYHTLPALYQKAEFSLNLNSLLLPAGLTQRIFDVWVAGGFCLTDYSDGLKIFPQELVNEICFSSAQNLPELVQNFVNNPARKKEIRAAWREHILAEHTYINRLQKLLEDLT